MKYVYWALALIFFLFTLVQYNDPNEAIKFNAAATNFGFFRYLCGKLSQVM